MKADNKLCIAIIGTRGIPANYGGFETFVEVLSTKLVERGYEVMVYCRKGAVDWDAPVYKGVRLVFLPTIKHKYFDTIAHTFLSVLHVIFTPARVVFFCNAINSSFIAIPRLCGKKTVINVDGLEWKRAKWNWLGKWAYRVSERIATLLAHVIVSDSRGIQQYYRDTYKKETTYIAYGADIPAYVPPGDCMRSLGLEKRNFILYVSRLEPENNAHVVIKAYEKVKSDMPLVIVGDAPYSRGYIEALKSTHDRRVIFTGSIYGDRCNELRCNAYLYIHGNEVGGTNPALLEAMAAGNCVIANGVSFNKDVLGDAGVCFNPGDTDDLAHKIEYLMQNPAQVEKYRALAVERIKERYTWDAIVSQYDALFRSLL